MSEASRHLNTCRDMVDEGLGHIHRLCTVAGRLNTAEMDQYQQAIFDLAVSSSELQAAQVYLDYSDDKSTFEQQLASSFVAEVLHLVQSRLLAAPQDYGIERTDDPNLSAFIAANRSTLNLAPLGAELMARQGDVGSRGLDSEKQLMAETFRQFASDVVAPLAEDIHRQDLIIPEAILDGIRELGCFGLSVPQRYGGLLPDDQEDSLGMIVVTEELSRVSLGGAGSLITRPEILSRALLEGGTDEQKSHWLPKIAAGNPLCAIAITEPDYGSDVASMKLKATAVEDGWVLNGAKTWSTFAGKAGVLLTLARTNPDPSLGHRGLSLFMVEKPVFDQDEFEVNQQGGGCLTGKAIATVGYRGMHSYQLFFDDFFIPDSHLIGQGQGLDRGFYFTMRGFTGGRIQTAARACGVIQGALDEAVRYAGDRQVFGKAVGQYQLTQVKFARMAMYLAASRQFTYAVGRMMDQGEGQMEASLVKLFACRAAEWITREAMQIHGGMGYAEESPVSRYWVDARVLSIFEGTEETLALKVVGRSLIERAA
jgi:(2S)-methylsuccinyl-CoA dehydrogenase